MSTFRDVVVNHHRESDAVLIASHEPCITIANDERRKVAGRSFRVIRAEDLDAVTLQGSWILAVVLCPGDDLASLIRWVAEGDRDPRRILFYLHTTTDARAAFGEWHRAGLPIHSTWVVRDWVELHKHFGNAWNLRVFDDFRKR